MALANITEESIEMDQELAKKLFVEGACLVLLGVPPGTEIGIDLKSWETAERFKGIKMIPPGVHFVYYSATSKHGDVAPRSGFIHFFKKSEVLVKKWDTKKEDISNEDVPDETVERIRADLKTLDKSLGVYPYDIYGKWVKLSDHMSERLVARLVPESGYIRSALEYTCSATTNQPTERKRRSRPSTAEEKEEDLLPQLTAAPGTQLRLTQYPEHSYPEGSTPQDITRHSLDSTYTLDTLLSSYDSPNDLLGEIQFCFVCFLVGHCLEALDQWKQLVRLMCSCETAVCKRTQLYSHFLDLLEEHLNQIPEDFLVDIVASVNLVYRSLRVHWSPGAIDRQISLFEGKPAGLFDPRDLFRTMHTNSEVDGRLRSKAERFQQRLTKKFEWDFDNLDEDEEDEAPVIVNL